MCKFISDLPCLFSLNCLIPTRAEGNMSKHFYLLQGRILEVQSQDIRCGRDLHNNVKILCGCYKDTLHHQTDQGANPVCAGWWPQDPGLLAEALIGSFLYITGLTCSTRLLAAEWGCVWNTLASGPGVGWRLKIWQPKAIQPHTVRQGNTESTVSVGHQETETNIKSIKCIFFRLKQSIPFQ